MDESSGAPNVNPLLAAAPRHLRRRRARKEIPDPLLVPGAQPVAPPSSHMNGRTPAPSVRPASSAAEKSYRRKRLVAMGLVILVSVSVVCLVVALMLNG